MAARRRNDVADPTADDPRFGSTAPPIAVASDAIDSWIASVAQSIIGDDLHPTLDGKLEQIGISIDDLYALLQHETIDYPELVPILDVWAAEYARTNHVSLDTIAQRAGWKA